MRRILLAFLILISPAIALGQDERSRNAESVRSAIQDLARRSGKASVMTRKLVGYSGKVVAADAATFDLKIKKNISTIKYEDVLELSAGGKKLSFVPATTRRGHGLWNDIGKVYPGTKLVIVLSSGKIVNAFANSATGSSMIIIERERHERMEIARDQIDTLYGLVGGYGGVKKGASKGAEGMATGGRNALLGGMLTGVAALAGLVKSDGRPILVYSR